MPKSDPYIDELVQPIINLYNQMELELIVEIANRFANYDEITGSLEWQLKKLNELGGLNAEVVKIIAKYSGKSQQEIERMLKEASILNLDIDELKTAYENGMIAVDPVVMMQSRAIAQTIELSYKSLNKTFSLIQTKAKESAKQAYLDILNQSYLEVASGMYDYSSSIKKAVQRMASKGIQGATYKRGNTTVQYSIEGTVRRDTLTAVHQLANKVSLQACEEMKCDYVEISQHIGARVSTTNPIANHAGWQGKVFKIEGKDKDYSNLKESTGYPDDIQGLGGVNCRHRMFPFWPGISVKKPMRYGKEENELVYKNNQHLRRLEREMRALKKKRAAAKAIDDKATVAALNRKIKDKSAQINDFCKENNLKRDYSRELVSEQLTKTPKPVAKSEKDGIIGAGSEKMKINSIERPIELPIEQRNTGKGNPNAILQIGRPLNNRQQQLLEQLSEFDSRIIVAKNDVKMTDLSALTAVTGDEFAMFTKGGERLIIRGSSVQVNIDNEAAKELSAKGYRWSGHTHPGMDYNALQASPGDKAVLRCFNQKNAVIYNSKGQFLIFERE